MYISLQTKISLTILTIVLLFTFFTLYYFPAQQRKLLLNSYNSEMQNLSNTVALGVRIALNEQNYEGVQTAMEFVKGNPDLQFVSLLEIDTVWNNNHTAYQIKETVFKTFPEGVVPEPGAVSNDSTIIKRTAFHTSMMSGAIMLGFSTAAINQSVKRIFRTSLLISSSIFVVGLLIGLWMSRSISAPVTSLRNATRRIGKGDLSPVGKDFSNDEIGDLANGFNVMVKELSQSREELETANLALSRTNSTLSKTLEDLKATQTQLIQSEKMASLGELTAGIAHEIQNPLNFVKNFSEVSVELTDELEVEMKKGNTSDALELAGSIKENLQKITYHGKRADSIVKNMLQHSHKRTELKEPTDINLLVKEYLNLSYHGLRAQDKSFNALMETHFDSAVGTIKVVPQDIGRVLLNLFNNAFYSVNKKKKAALIQDYQPAVTVSTVREKNLVMIYIKDNGLGIPEIYFDKIFQPFFTTKPTGEGTGLGLSLSYDIITKGHAGQMFVETKEGEYAQFKIVLPA